MHNVWFAATVLGVATFASAQVVSVPQGTAIRVRLDQTLSSSTSKSGDTVRFEALDNVFADGKIAVARSAVVGGEIIDTKGSDGHIRFVVRYVVAADGSRLDVNSSRHAKGSKGSRNVGIGMAIVGPELGPAFLLAHGSDSSFPAGTAFTVYTSKVSSVDVSDVAGAQASATGPGAPIEERTVSVTGGGMIVPSMTTSADPQMSLADAARIARASKAAAKK